MPTAPCFYIKKANGESAKIDLAHFPFTVGRARECDYVIDSSQVSRLHVQFDFDYQQVQIRDLGSTNGTFLNGERLTPHRNYKLRASDVVRLANDYNLTFDDPATTHQLEPQEMEPVALRLDEASANVYILDELLDPPLSPSQFMLLQLLVSNEDTVVTRDEIRRYVWGEDEDVNDQTIDALVSRLRKRLQDADDTHDYIITRRGFGLMFRNRQGVAANR
jgi:pSer/pThr/pTyr-binding forkhead associated (FHA) protein